jgi:hypothetical protein
MPPSERRTRLVEPMTLSHDQHFGIPIVAVEETMRGWLAAIAKERLARRQVTAYFLRLRTPVLWAGEAARSVNTPHDIPESEEFVDCSGTRREFSLKCHQVPTGWAVTATEVTGNDFGYMFVGFSPSNPYLALGQVRAKIRAGLAIRYLSAAEPEPTLIHDILRGHIDWDRTIDRPILVVDRRPLSMVDLERILGSYEGWRLELRIVDASE